MRTQFCFALLGSLILFACTEDAGTGLAGGGPLSDTGMDGATVSSVDGGTSAVDLGATDAMLMSDSATMPAVDMAVPEAPTCESTCRRFVECAELVCPMGNGIVLRAACRMACQDSPGFAQLAENTAECADLVTFVGRRSDAVAERCGEGTVPTNPACEPYATKANSCMAEACPNILQLGPGGESLFRSICSDAIARGDWQTAQLDGIADAMCSHPLIGPVVSFITVVGDAANSGGLAPLCAEGALVSAEVCDSACLRLGECIPEGTSEEMGGYLRDYPACRYVCGVTDGISSVTWDCVANENACRQAFQCFEMEPEPVEECGPYSDLIARCVVAECEQAMSIQAGVAAYAFGICNALVNDGPFMVEQIAEVTAADACGMATAPMVLYLLDTEAPGEGAGVLEGLCADMPANPVALCQTACANLAPCIPEDGEGRELRDRDFCEIFCATNTDAISSDAWQCFTEAPMCADIGLCFAGQ